MPYKNRATRLEYMRNYYRMNIKPDNELRNANKGLNPPLTKTPSSRYLSKNPALTLESRAIPARIASAPVPLKPEPF